MEKLLVIGLRVYIVYISCTYRVHIVRQQQIAPGSITMEAFEGFAYSHNGMMGVYAALCCLFRYTWY